MKLAPVILLEHHKSVIDRSKSMMPIGLRELKNLNKDDLIVIIL